MHDLYGLDNLTADNLERAFSVVEENAGDAGWTHDVLANRCGITESITVEGNGMSIWPGIRKGREGAFPVNIVNGKRSPQDVLRSMEESLGREIRSAQDYRDLALEIAGKLPPDKMSFVGLSPLAWLTPELTREEEITHLITKVKAGQTLSHTELGSFSYFGLMTALDALWTTPLRTIQLVVGAEVLLPTDPSQVGARCSLARSAG